MGINKGVWTYLKKPRVCEICGHQTFGAGFACTWCGDRIDRTGTYVHPAECGIEISVYDAQLKQFRGKGKIFTPKKKIVRLCVDCGNVLGITRRLRCKPCGFVHYRDKQNDWRSRR